jgi:hypothetical protein
MNTKEIERPTVSILPVVTDVLLLEPRRINTEEERMRYHDVWDGCV